MIPIPIRPVVAFLLLLLAANLAAQDPARKRVVVYGDSLTAGYGLGKEFAFPAVLQQKVDAEDLPFEMVNSGISGDTSAGGLRRIAWNLSRPVDVLILGLGANDGLRGIDPAETEKNLQAIIDQTKARNPDFRLIVAGMTLPPNLGPEFIRDFEGVFRKIAERNDGVLIPFLLTGVAGRPELNLPDGIHPTKEGHRMVAETVWTYLSPVLREIASGK
ncbi:MAG: arylesterase [Acidobacteriota bacterium]|nr:arylesterase [Acidobacteriota bacterium]